MENTLQTVYLGGGCFWCTEAIFKSLEGVVSVIPGYMGGTKQNPSYQEVCGGMTGHAEVVRAEYDESKISTADLLEIFFDLHDPTSLNRQGNDVGTQYRSVIFYTSDRQKEEAEFQIQKLSKSLLLSDKKIVTEVSKASEFYPAEEYHRGYYLKNTQAPYCQLIISPKLEKLQKKFGDKLDSNY